MKHSVRQFLAKRLSEARGGVRKPKVLGYNNKKKKCENCGKENLNRTIEIQFPNGNISYFGSECANRLKSISYVPSRRKSTSDHSEETRQKDLDADQEEDLEEDQDYEEEDEDEESYDEEEQEEELEEDNVSEDDILNLQDQERESYLESDSPDLYDQEYSSELSTDYLSDPLPTFESKPSIENFDKRFQINDIVFDSQKGKASIAHSSNIRNVGFAAKIKPAKFLELAMPFNENTKRVESIKILEDSKMIPGWGPPVLYVDIDSMEVNGHEGRHRSSLFKKWYPHEYMVVHIIVRDKNLYIKNNLSLQDVKNINKGLFNEYYSNLSKDEKSKEHNKKNNFVKGKLFNEVFFDREGKKFQGKI